MSTTNGPIRDVDGVILNRGDSVELTDEVKAISEEYRGLGVGKISQLWPTEYQVSFHTSTHSVSIGLADGRFIRKVPTP